MTSHDSPTPVLADFLQDRVFPEMAILTIKSDYGPSLNITGPFCFWAIERGDKQPPIMETVITRPVDTIETPSRAEPPFHVHVNEWARVGAARLRDHGSNYLRDRYPKLLELLNDDGKAMLWWYVDLDHANKLAAVIGASMLYPFES